MAEEMEGYISVDQNTTPFGESGDALRGRPSGASVSSEMPKTPGWTVLGMEEQDQGLGIWEHILGRAAASFGFGIGVFLVRREVSTNSRFILAAIAASVVGGIISFILVEAGFQALVSAFVSSVVAGVVFESIARI